MKKMHFELIEKLLNLDNIFMNIDPNEWYIDKIAYECGFSNDEVSNNIYHLIYNNKEVSFENNVCTFLLEHYEKFKCPIIKCLLDYIFSTNKEFYKHSNLEKNFINIWNNCFSSWKEEQKIGLSLHSIDIILSWIIKKFPNSKVSISNLIFDDLNSNALTALNCYTIINMLLNKNDGYSLIQCEKYNELIIKRFKIDEIDKNEIYAYYDFLLSFSSKFSSMFKFNPKQIYQKICDLYSKFSNEFSVEFKQINLLKIRSFLDALKSDNSKLYSAIDKEIDSVAKITLGNLKSIKIKLPAPVMAEAEEAIQNEKKFYSKLPINERIYNLLFKCKPIEIETLKSNVLKRKEQSVTSIIPITYLDEKGRVINYETLKDFEMFSLEIRDNFTFYIDIFMELFFKTYFEISILKNDFSEINLTNIVSNSLLMQSNLVDASIKAFSTFFKGDFENSVGKIILKFETDLRKLLSNNGMNVYKKDGSYELIDLNYIFNYKDKNSFKEYLLTLINEDYYFNLTWLLTDKYGYNLRNKIAHEFEDPNILSTHAAIYTTTLIIRMYIFLQKQSS